jgi:hypothetical protein
MASDRAADDKARATADCSDLPAVSVGVGVIAVD